MSEQECKPKKRFGDSFVVPLSRTEWEEERERDVALGLANPDETYEDYLDGLRRDFLSVCFPRSS